MGITVHLLGLMVLIAVIHSVHSRHREPDAVARLYDIIYATKYTTNMLEIELAKEKKNDIYRLTSVELEKAIKKITEFNKGLKLYLRYFYMELPKSADVDRAYGRVL